MTFSEAAMIMMSGGNKVIQPLNVTENGSYEAPEGVGGYNPVNVSVFSEAITEGLSVTSNGTYTPPAGVDGYNPVTVNVDDRYDEGYDEGYADGESSVKAKIQSKTITENGIYYAADDGLDGFDPVNVNVPDNYDDGYDKGYEDGWEASAGYYDGSGASTDKHYLLHIFVDTVSIPGYQNTNPVAFHLYEKKDGAWSIVNKFIHYVNENAHYSYDTKINYIKLSSEYGKPSYVGLTGWTKDHSISRTEVFNYSNALVYGVSSKNCALTSVAPTT